MSHNLQIFSLLEMFTLFAAIQASRLNTYTPLNDQTYQDLLHQQFSQNQNQQQQQQQQMRFIPQAYKNGYLDDQQNSAINFRYQQNVGAQLDQNFRNFDNLQYIQPIPRRILTPNQQLPPYRQQSWTGRPIVAGDVGSKYQQHQQQQQKVAANADVNGAAYVTRQYVAPYQGINLRPYHSDFYGRQNQIDFPSSREFVQLPAASFQLNRESKNADYAAHFENYLRKYPQRLEPRFLGNSYL